MARVLNSVHVIGIAPRGIGAWLAAKWVGIATGRYTKYLYRVPSAVYKRSLCKLLIHDCIGQDVHFRSANVAY